MAERMTSRAEATQLRKELDALTNRLEREGFGRGQVGAAMLGCGGALLAVSDGTATLSDSGGGES